MSARSIIDVVRTSTRCVTHHYACDCREAQHAETIQMLLIALDALRPARAGAIVDCWCPLDRDIRTFGHTGTCLEVQALKREHGSRQFLGPLPLPAITLRGPVPSKKNNYERVTVRGVPTLAVNKRTRQLLDGLQPQLQASWNRLNRDPLVHPQMHVHFKTSTDQIDRDGMFTSICDLLQGVKAIKRDSIAQFNGRLVIEPAELVPDGYEQTAIVFREQAK